jgi:hypothetical protein
MRTSPSGSPPESSCGILALNINTSGATHVYPQSEILRSTERTHCGPSEYNHSRCLRGWHHQLVCPRQFWCNCEALHSKLSSRRFWTVSPGFKLTEFNRPFAHVCKLDFEPTLRRIPMRTFVDCDS